MNLFFSAISATQLPGSLYLLKDSAPAYVDIVALSLRSESLRTRWTSLQVQSALVSLRVCSFVLTKALCTLVQILTLQTVLSDEWQPFKNRSGEPVLALTPCAAKALSPTCRAFTKVQGAVCNR